jgi:hypothetical protein
LWKEENNRKIIEDIYKENYPWPLGKLIYLNEYYFVKNKLDSSNDTSKLTRQDILNKFIEVNDSLDRKLNNTNKNNDDHFYLIENRFSEADILLYSYLKVLNTYKQQFEFVLSSLENFKNLQRFYLNLNQKYSHILNEKLNI